MRTNNPFPPTSRQSVVTLTHGGPLSTSPGEITSKNGTLPDWLATCSNRAASTLCTRPHRVCPWTRRSFLRRSCPTCQMCVAFQALFLSPPPITMPSDRATHAWRVWRKKQVLVVPSCLSPFARVVEGAACVNPGFAVDGAAYGTAALLTLHRASVATTTTVERLEVKVLRL